MIRNHFLAIFLISILSIGTLHSNFVYADSVKGVLVVSEKSELNQISRLEIRRIYLGLPASIQPKVENPILNVNDKEFYRAFLKNVMHMTENGYRRKSVKRIFRQGGGKILEIGDLEKLVEHLRNNPNDISFMDEVTAKKAPGIKVIKELW